MDFAFVPGASTGELLARALFERRSQTRLIQVRRVGTIRQFINHLNTASGISRPIDNLLIASHANNEGMLFIPLFPGQRGSTKFETLEDSIANASHSIKIPDALIGHTPGTPPSKFFHIRGCNIGKARPLLVKLREALGDNITVTAPKHSDRFFRSTARGVWEYMWYEHKIVRPNVFPNRNDAITKFQNKGFTLIDGITPVPSTEWPTRIPANITRTTPLSITTKLGVTVAGRRTLPAGGEFRVVQGKFKYTIRYPSASQVPTTQTAQMNDLTNDLNNNPRFDSTHPFPEYERWGYTSITDFLAGYIWRFRKSRKTLVCRGLRMEYTVFVPILDVASSNLIFNFYPNAGSSQPPITTGLVESDARFFESV